MCKNIYNYKNITNTQKYDYIISDLVDRRIKLRRLSHFTHCCIFYALYYPSVFCINHLQYDCYLFSYQLCSIRLNLLFFLYDRVILLLYVFSLLVSSLVCEAFLWHSNIFYVVHSFKKQ